MVYTRRTIRTAPQTPAECFVWWIDKAKLTTLKEVAPSYGIKGTLKTRAKAKEAWMLREDICIDSIPFQQLVLRHWKQQTSNTNNKTSKRSRDIFRQTYQKVIRWIATLPTNLPATLRSDTWSKSITIDITRAPVFNRAQGPHLQSPVDSCIHAIVAQHPLRLHYKPSIQSGRCSWDVTGFAWMCQLSHTTIYLDAYSEWMRYKIQTVLLKYFLNNNTTQNITSFLSTAELTI